MVNATGLWWHTTCRQTTRPSGPEVIVDRTLKEIAMRWAGLLLNLVGAFTLAYAQASLWQLTQQWLGSLQASVQALAEKQGPAGNSLVSTERAFKINKVISAIGWGLMAIGFLLQLRALEP
jgi:hypothetical protein